MPKHLEKFWTWCWLNVSCHTLYGWHNAWRTADKMRGVADIMHGTANTMYWCGWRNSCEVWRVGQNQSWTPPHMAKNKFLLNEYLGIFMHFESIFFIFLNLENGLFQTHPPTKSGKFQIFFFFEPFPNTKHYLNFIRCNRTDESTLFYSCVRK